jgi:hypothetical protein
VQNDFETIDFGLAERHWQGTANAYITEREPNAHGPRQFRLFISNWQDSSGIDKCKHSLAQGNRI